MNRKLVTLVLGTGGLVASALPITAQAQEGEEEPTVEQRVTRLERELAGLETRFEARTLERPSRADGPPRGVTLSTRVRELEQRLDRLANELMRVERQAAAALREASAARRDAMAAERIARDAALRSR